jgi:uncharacterized protein (DUF1015 family)
VKATEAEIDFTSPDGVRHTVWPVPDPAAVSGIFETIPCSYVADGHHRTASAARCSKEFADANPAHTGNENYNWFLTVMFAADDLMVLPYNRLIRGLNELTAEEVVTKAREAGFAMEHVQGGTPDTRADIRMFVGGSWYKLVKPAAEGADPVEALDVSILQNDLIGPVLGVEDPRTDNRISFKGGFDCVAVLEKMVRGGKADVAFSLYPTSTEEVMAVSDAGMIMPPKSTWFEPKLRSGLFVHQLNNGTEVAESV